MKEKSPLEMNQWDYACLLIDVDDFLEIEVKIRLIFILFFFLEGEIDWRMNAQIIRKGGRGKQMALLKVDAN